MGKNLSKKLHCILLPFSKSLSLLVSLFYTGQEKENEPPGVLAISLPLPWLCPVARGRWLTGVRNKLLSNGQAKPLCSEPEPPPQEAVSAPRMLAPRAGRTHMLWGPSPQVSFHVVHEPAFNRLIAKKVVLLPLFFPIRSLQ